MELTDQNLATLAQYLQLTLSPQYSVRKPAEQFLEGVESNSNYGLLMLRLIDKKDLDLTIRIAGSIAFKNYVKRNWAEDSNIATPIPEPERAQVRTSLVELMLHSPGPVQKQLSDAVSIVGKHDFPTKWPGLITQMVEKFATEDFHIINGVLQTAHSLFKRYRYEFKSEELWTEIAFVLAHFAKPLTELFVGTLGLRQAHADNPDALRVIYSSLLLICKVFHSLNSQDLPEYFEDNMHIWMPNLLLLLQAKVPSLDTDDDNESSVVERVREAAVESAGLYALKYSEEFLPHAPGFVTAAWGALVDAGPQPKYDALVSGALSFLSNVAEKKHYRYLFDDKNTLAQICEKVIIPNMEFRESDQELFEDNAEEYIRRDIEGSDVETRRRAACDLVKVLSVNFEEQIFQIFGQYVQAMLERSAGAADGSQWKCKDIALFLVTSMSERGRTARTGVTATSSFVDLNSFFRDHVLPDLTAANINFTPVLKADAIKYVITFRSLLPKENIASLVPCLIQFLNADSVVVASYAVNCLEKILPIVGPTPNLLQIAPNLIQALLQLLEKPGHNESDYAMKCVMRSLMVLQNACLPILGNALTQFAKTLTIVAKNPSRPNFNHYLFECISLSIKLVCKASPAAVESFEDVFFPIFQDILQQEVQEFMPYVFQLLSLLVEQRCAFSSGGLPENSPYLALVSCLLTPPLWDRAANVRALVRLLSALTVAANQQLIRDNRLNGMLGVFQKLIASKANDQEGFTLIQNMLQYIPNDTMRPYLKQIISLMFQRLSSSKTTKFIRGLIVFLGFYVLRFGAANLVETLDETQPFLFAMYCERILIPELQKVTGSIEVKMTTVGYTKLLCECPDLYRPDGKYRGLWVKIMEALIALFELPNDETLLPDDQLIDVTEETAYQPAYCQLMSARQDVPDILKDVAEPRQFLSQSLGNFSASNPGVLPSLLEQMSADHRTALSSYLQKFGVAIV